MRGSQGRENSGNLFAILLLVICIPQCIYATSINKITSTELPKKICANHGVYINQTSKCYTEGWRGPCGELMKVKITDANLGTGKCECKSECGERPSIFWPEQNRCFYIFDQGPCPEGKWLVPSRKSAPRCENIPCPEEYNRQVKPVEPEVPGITNFTYLYHYVFPYENNCYITDTENDGLCPEGDETAQFHSPKTPHVCMGPNVCPLSITGGGANRYCLSGTEADIHGGCEPQTLFD